MRAALAGLTIRGRSFLAAGVTACGCGLVLAETDLLRVGIFLCALPLITAWLVARTRYRLSSRRDVDPARVPAGQAARVTLRLENLSRVPLGALRLEDQIPYSLGSRPRFVLSRLESHGKRQVTYEILSELRGHYTIGPLALRIADPLGLVELTRSFTTSERFVVTPPVVPLPSTRLGGHWSGSGESHARTVATAGEDDTTTREYRHGDDLRRVHWRSTARYGDLMVRREEQPWDSRGVILLDGRAAAHRGIGPASSYEWAVMAAASVGVHLSRMGFGLSAVDDTGRRLIPHDPGAVGVQAEGLLLDSLAGISPSKGRSLLDGLSAARRSSNGGLVVAVLGALSDPDIEALGRFRHAGVDCVAIMLDVVAWNPAKARAARDPGDVTPRVRVARQHMTAAGWRVAIATPFDDLRSVWAATAEAGVAVTTGADAS